MQHGNQFLPLRNLKQVPRQQSKNETKLQTFHTFHPSKVEEIAICTKMFRLGNCCNAELLTVILMVPQYTTNSKSKQKYLKFSSKPEFF